MNSCKPILEWLREGGYNGEPLTEHLYRDGVWFGSVGKAQQGRWAVYEAKAGEGVCFGSERTLEAARRVLERKAAGK